MDDLIWISPDGDGLHQASTSPLPGYILYARVDTLVEAEREQGKPRRKKPDNTPESTEI